MKRVLLLLAVMVGFGMAAAQTTITYWQYDYATRVDAFDFAMEVDRTGPTPVLRIERAVSGTSE